MKSVMCKWKCHCGTKKIHENQKDTRCLSSKPENMITFEPDISKYSTVSIMGQCFDGAAVVHLAKHLPSGKMIALKKFHMEKDEVNLVQHEIILTKQLQHRNILSYFIAFVHGPEVCVISPLMAYGSCRDLLNMHFNEGMSENAIALIIKDILDGLDYIHKKGFIHRAIRASHVLISVKGRACLSGLRYACPIVKNGKWQRQIHSFPASTAKNLNWLSPEVLEQNLRGYNEKSDIYSIGMVVCELANGAEPFAGVSTTLMLTEKVRGSAPQLLDCSTLPRDENEYLGDAELGGIYSNQAERRFSDGLHQIAALCLQREPVCRPSAAQLLNHPFLRINRRSLYLPDLLKPAIPLSDRVASNTEELANFDAVQRISNLDLYSCEWDF